MNKRLARIASLFTVERLSASPDHQGEMAADEVGHLRIDRVRAWYAFLAVAIVFALVRVVSWGSLPATQASVAPTEFARGLIVDRNGFPLAMDSFTREAYANPYDFHNDLSNPVSELTRIGDLLQISPETLQERLSGPGYAVLLKSGITPDQCDAADHSSEIPLWVWCDRRRERTYPLGSMASHLLGFTDSAGQGLSGIEAAYDGWLRDVGSSKDQVLSSTPAPVPEPLRTFLPSENGQDLWLTIDGRLQHAVEQSLQKAVTETGSQRGTVIVMDPRTGELMAMANYPTFDPNHYSQVSGDLWTNSAISESYEPGSLFTIVTIAGALDARVISPESLFENSNLITIEGRAIRDTIPDTGKPLTLTQLLTYPQQNVEVAKIGLQMGQDTFYRYLRQFAFGRPTEVDLSAEGAGYVRKPGDPSWNQFQQAANAFGQGIAVTPLQLLNAVAAIANGGNLLQPSAALGLVKEGQIHRIPPRIMGQPIGPETAEQITKALVDAAKSLPGTDLGPGFEVAGKVGVAEIASADGYLSNEKTVSFVGFFPADNPQLIILVKLDRPRNQRQGEQTAISLFDTIARKAIDVLPIEPTQGPP